MVTTERAIPELEDIPEECPQNSVLIHKEKKCERKVKI